MIYNCTSLFSFHERMAEAFKFKPTPNLCGTCSFNLSGCDLWRCPICETAYCWGHGFDRHRMGCGFKDTQICLRCWERAEPKPYCRKKNCKCENRQPQVQGRVNARRTRETLQMAKLKTQNFNSQEQIAKWKQRHTPIPDGHHALDYFLISDTMEQYEMKIFGRQISSTENEELKRLVRQTRLRQSSRIKQY